MSRSLKLCFFVSMLLISQVIPAQQPATTSERKVETTKTETPGAPSTKPKKESTNKDAAAKPKLTPDQLLAKQTLEAMEGPSRGLEAPMRSYTLLQIGSAYAASNPAKARILLQDAFSASLAVQDMDEPKQILQQEIFSALLPISQADVEERLTQAEPQARKRASAAIVKSYTEKKQFDRAMDVVQQMTSSGEFPYNAAVELLEAMPAEMSGEKQAMFASATASFRGHEHKEIVGLERDFTTVVQRFGASMPPKLALEAIDEILSQAKKNDQDVTFAVGGAGGSASFSSAYEYELFVLLPLLRTLDESGANRLLEENNALKITAQKYPKGLDSVNPPEPGKDPHPPMMMIGMGGGGGGGNQMSQEEGMRQEMQRRNDLIMKMAETDPTQAIAQATVLPLTISMFGVSPRASALQGIARLNAKKQPAAGRQAVAELRKTAMQLPLDDQEKFLASSAKLYLEMDDKDKAEDVVGEALKVAAKMLENDMNPDDPNKALKAWWPSTNAYRQMVDIETKISHPATAKLLQEIKDPDVRTVESINFARALLGQTPKLVRVMVNRKDMNMHMMNQND